MGSGFYWPDSLLNIQHVPMKHFKRIRILLILFLLSRVESNAQFYFLTRDIIDNTKYIRKKQTAHKIESTFSENAYLIINFNASHNRKSRQQPCHIKLPLDSILSHASPKSYSTYRFDSLFSKEFNVHSLSNRYSNISKKSYARGIDLMCLQEIIRPGYYTQNESSSEKGVAEIYDKDEEEPFELDDSSKIYLQGKHIVFLYYFYEPKEINGEVIDYVVINIENNPKIEKLNYLKLPGVIILDTIMIPFILIQRGHKK